MTKEEKRKFLERELEWRQKRLQKLSYPESFGDHLYHAAATATGNTTRLRFQTMKEIGEIKKQLDEL